MTIAEVPELASWGEVGGRISEIRSRKSAARFHSAADIAAFAAYRK